MSLDLTILDERDRPAVSVSLSPDDHWAIFGRLQPADFPLLARLGDYYEDAKWSVGELPRLEAELKRLKASAFGTQEKHLCLIDEALSLVQTALDCGSDLLALAD
jgi:hypothetical protein